MNTREYLILHLDTNSSKGTTLLLLFYISVTVVGSSIISVTLFIPENECEMAPCSWVVLLLLSINATSGHLWQIKLKIFYVLHFLDQNLNFITFSSPTQLIFTTLILLVFFSKLPKFTPYKNIPQLLRLLWSELIRVSNSYKPQEKPSVCCILLVILVEWPVYSNLSN